MSTNILQTLFFLTSNVLCDFGLFQFKRPIDVRYFKNGKIQGKFDIAAPPIGRYPPISNQDQFFLGATEYCYEFVNIVCKICR